jgi:hypothetical protein
MSSLMVADSMRPSKSNAPPNATKHRPCLRQMYFFGCGPVAMDREKSRIRRSLARPKRFELLTF